MKFDGALNLVNFNGDLVDFFGRKPKKCCPSCGFEFENFEDTGVLGCSKCYDTFHDEIVAEIASWK